jgi:hypothetical protein
MENVPVEIEFHHEKDKSINSNEKQELKRDPETGTEITEEIINEILTDKERHLDVLNMPAKYEKALCHLKATQIYTKSYIENLEGKITKLLYQYILILLYTI